MIECLKVFEIDPELKSVDKESETYQNLDFEVNDFFKKHMKKSIENKKAKLVRFRNENSSIVNQSKKCFVAETFEEGAKEIARNLAFGIHANVVRNFHFIVVVYRVEDDNWLYDRGERILGILKMETNNGVQMRDEDFLVQADMLPDLGNQLQKCSFIFESFLNNYEENNNGENYHSKILDKQDSTISNYFMNLMESIEVANDELMSKYAEQFIKKHVKPFVDKEDYILVDNKVDTIMSRRENTSVSAIVNQLQEYIRLDFLEAAQFTIDGLANDIFSKIQGKNPSVHEEFLSTPFKPEKYMLKNEARSVIISIEQSLVNDGIVNIETDNDNYSITIPNELMD